MKKLFKNLSIYINNFFFPFYKSKDLKLLFKNLEKDEKGDKEVAMFVGGCVRNFLKSKKIDDIDIATIFSPDQIKIKLSRSNFRVIDTGIEHGSVTVVANNKKFELTTLRKDLNTDGRHADIEIIDNWQEDSKRRDFTINAIYLNKKGKIFDPQQGVNDLNNNSVKFIGDPQTRIEEDFLRIIRFLRFSLQYKSQIDQSTAKAIKINLNGIKNLSKERILSELFKIINLKNFDEIISDKELLNIFKLIFPEFVKIERLKKFKLLKNFVKISNELYLSILLVDNKKNHEYFSHKYRVSGKTSETLSILGDNYINCINDKDFFKKKLKLNLYNIGAENLKTVFCLYLLDKKNLSKKDIAFFKIIDGISIPKFPYDGQYLIKKGVKEGKAIGKILKAAKQGWIENDFSLSQLELDNMIKNTK